MKYITLILSLVATSAMAQITELQVPGAQFSIAFGVASNGDVVGIYGCGEDCPFHGYWYHADTGTFTDLGIRVWSEGINDQGDIVGEYQTGHGRFGFLLRKGVLIDLNDIVPADSGMYVVAAHSITNSGLIAGDWQDLVNGGGSKAIIIQTQNTKGK